MNAQVTKEANTKWYVYARGSRTNNAIPENLERLGIVDPTAKNLECSDGTTRPLWLIPSYEFVRNLHLSKADQGFNYVVYCSNFDQRPQEYMLGKRIRIPLEEAKRRKIIKLGKAPKTKGRPRTKQATDA